MKRFILLFILAVFTIVATSCVGGTPMPSAAQGTGGNPTKLVVIVPMDPDSHGKKPDVVPEYVQLEYGKKEQVKWIIPLGLVFTITFDKNGCPFEQKVFTNKEDTSKPVLSGRVIKDPGDQAQVFFYSLEVEGHDKLDPGVIVRR